MANYSNENEAKNGERFHIFNEKDEVILVEMQEKRKYYGQSGCYGGHCRCDLANGKCLLDNKDEYLECPVGGVFVEVKPNE